jgi:hypothetical protein
MLAVVIVATAGPGYLPLVGPPTPRFAVPPSIAFTGWVALPPLLLRDPSTDPRIENGIAVSNTVVGVESVTVSPIVATFEPDLFSQSAFPLEPPPTNAMSSPMDLLGPPMLLKYFGGNRGSNASGASIYIPISFIPPVPGLQHSSSASFEIVPSTQP